MTSPAHLLAQLAADGRLAARNRIVFASVDSTNEVGKGIAELYRRRRQRLPACVVVALRQSSGKGRLGRKWHSPPGGIYASYLWSSTDLEALQTLPLRIPLALRGALAEMLGVACRVKWPNDLVVEGRKIGGILIETLSTGRGLSAVIGFGINYRGEAVRSIERATALAEVAARPAPFEEVVLGLLLALETELGASRTMPELVAELDRWSIHREGEEIRCQTAAGILEGAFRGFDDAGFLRLETSAGERLVSSADILETKGTREHEL